MSATSKQEPNQTLAPERKKSSMLFSQDSINELVTSAGSITNTDKFLDDLLHKLGEQFDFDAASFLLFDAASNSTRYERIYKKHIRSTFSGLNFANMAFSATPMATVAKLTDLAVFNNLYWQTNYPDLYGNGQLDKVYNDQCYVPLSWGKSSMGTLILYSNDPELFSEGLMDLLRDLSGQLSLAVGLLAWDKRLLHAESEKNALLEVASSISAVQNRNDLLTVMLSELKKLIPFDAIAITVPGYDQSNLMVFLKYTGSEIKTAQSPNRSFSESYELKDGVTDVTLNASVPYLINLTEIRNERKIPPYLSFLKNENIQSAVGQSLRSNNKSIAALLLFSTNKNAYTSSQLKLIQDISNQLSLTVASLLFHERQEDLEGDKEILFSLINHIASVRDKNDLLKAIDHHLKSLFPVSDVAIRLYDDENKTHSVYLVVAGDVRKNHPDFKKMVNVDTTIYDGVFDRILMSDYPVLLDVEKEIITGNAPIYTKFLMATGIRETLNITLKNGDERIGTFVLYAEKKGAFKPKHFDLITAVGMQVSVAVANILANKNILNREKEKSFLLDLSNAVVNVRLKEDLINLVYTKLKTVIPITDAGISLISDDQKYKCGYLFIPGAERLNHPDFSLAANIKYNIRKGVYQKILASKEPLIYDPRDLRDEDPMDSPMRFLADTGIKQCVSVILRDGDIDIAYMCLFSEQADAFKRSHVSFIQAIAYQIAGSLGNILANNRVALQEHEKSILLSLSDKMANIRDRNDLLRVISTKFKELFDFSDIIISVINADKETKSIYLMDTRKEKRNHPLFNDFYHSRIDITQGLFKDVLESNQPLIFSVDENDSAGNPVQVHKFLLETGVKQGIAVTLKDGSDSIGFMSIFSDHADTFVKEQFGLIQGMANQIAGAFANVLANNEIVRRENEKSQLLAFSNELATVKNKHELADMITKKLKELLNNIDFNLVIVSEDGSTARNYLANPIYYSATTPGLDVINRPYAVPDGLFEKVIAAGEMIELDVHELAARVPIPTYVRLWQDVGFKSAFGTPIRLANKAIGIIWYCSKEKCRFNQSQYRLFKGISAQISVAVANIAANEEILNREKEKSLLLSFSHEISTVRNKKGLSAVINRYLTDLFMMETYLLSIKNEEDKTHSYFIYNLSPTLTKNPDFDNLQDRRFPIEGGLADIVFKADGQVDLALGELLEKGKVSVPEADFWLSAGLDKISALPLKVGDREVGIMWTRANHGSQNLLKGVMAQIAIAIANTLANEEIIAREKEKSTLLSLANDMNAIRNKEELFQVIYQKSEALFSTRNLAITMVAEDKKSFQIIPNKSAAWLFSNNTRILESGFGAGDQIFDKVVNAKFPVVYNISELTGLDNLPTYIQCLEQQGIAQVVGMPLRLGKEDLGIFWIFFLAGASMHPDKINLLKSVCAQLSVTISNISAFEKIKNQLIEIRQYKQRLQEEKEYLQDEINKGFNFTEIVGAGEEMKKVFRLISQVAESDSSVLLLGETGTGKELIARAIHDSSTRKGKLMVKVNCATLPANVIESELFGHEKGSFTGAIERRIGKFELANGGTLFLDEVGELPLELQSKLLRALQEKEIERVGGRSVIETDVRIIAATNRNLYKEVKAGNFRSDLFFRLDVFPIILPPLRQRVEDIPLLANHFLIKHARKSGRKVYRISDETLQSLVSYSWPGNVRELEHWIERSVLLATGPVITNILLPLEENSNLQVEPVNPGVPSIDDVERHHILAVLKKCGGRVGGPGGAAEMLNIPSSTLNSKIKRLGIKKEQFA